VIAIIGGDLRDGWDGELTIGQSGRYAPFCSPIIGCHNGGFNAAFTDGHAKWVKVTEVTSAAQYIDIGGVSHYPCQISGGPYDGNWELRGVVKSNHSVGEL